MKGNNNIHLLQILIPCLISSILVSSCYETNEGCLERWASNFDISADIACEDCCTEPSFSVTINRSYDNETIDVDSFYTNANNQTFRILNLKYLTSRFEVWNLDLDTIKKLDTTLIRDEIYVEDFAYINNSISNQTIGSIRDILQVDSISFYIGLEEPLRDTSIFARDNNVVGRVLDDLYVVEKDSIALFSLDMVLDSMKKDTIQFRYVGEEELFMNFGTSASINLSTGVSQTINLNFDIKKWTNSVLFDTLNTTLTEESLFNSFKSSFEIE